MGCGKGSDMSAPVPVFEMKVGPAGFCLIVVLIWAFGVCVGRVT